MPRVTIIQTNFTAGEVSPKCYGRVDVERYRNGAKTLENVIVGIHGGAQRRPGMKFIASAKHHDKVSRLVPFVFNRDQAYMLEFGENYIRFYEQSGGQILAGGSPYEVATPYTAAMLAELDYTQGADTMFIFHGDVLIHTLRRFASDSWSLQQAPFSAIPFDELGHRFNATLTLSAATVGAGRTINASASIFLAGDVGRRITHQGGTATISGYTSATAVTSEITAAFSDTAIPANDWKLEDSPQGTLVPSAKGPVGAIVALNLQADGSTPTYGTTNAIAGLSHNGTATATATIVAHGYTTGNTVQVDGCTPDGYNGTFTVTVIDPSTFTYSVSDPGAATVLGTAKSVTSSPTTLAGFRAEDDDKFIRVNGGLVRITSISSATSAQAEILTELSSVVGSPPNAWTLEGPVWNAVDGYPRTGVLHEQRLIAAATASAPQTVWGSKSAQYYDFTLGDVDDDALAIVLPSSGQINPIVRMSSINALLPLTYGGEYSITGGVEKPLTPTNRQIKSPSVHGCNNVKPVRVGGELLFVQRAGRKLRAFSYKPIEESYASPDLSVLAEHITQSGIVDMAYQQEPGSLVWCPRADGKIAAMTLDRDEGVTAWTRQSTDGFYESTATIPNATGDEVWVLVRRTIGGATKRYIERFDATLFTDSAITGASGPGAATWSGLSHLEGKVVQVRADGTHIGPHTVTGGQITLGRTAKTVEIGLPYTCQVELLRPEVQAGDGTAQGNNMRTSETSLLFHESVGGKVNGDALTTREFGSELLDEPPPEYSGYDRIGLSGWYRGDSPLVITQDEPLPFHLLAVVRKFTVNS